MFALTYHSRGARPFDEEELYELAASASKQNVRLGITGFLQYKKAAFLQYLEGEKAAVLSLMDKIAQDERHTITRIVHLPDIGQQHFGVWHMRYWTYDQFVEIKLTDLLEEVLLEMDENIYGEAMLIRSITRLVTRMSKESHDVLK